MSSNNTTNEISMIIVNDDFSLSDVANKTKVVNECSSDQIITIIFHLAYACFLIAYLSPGGKYCLLFMHSILALAHLLIIVWISHFCFTIPSLLEWCLTFFAINIFRVLAQIYLNWRAKFDEELEEHYRNLFMPLGVSRDLFKKLILQGTTLTLNPNESYALEKVTTIDRLSLLISGKVNVVSGNHFLHSINPGEFLDSPEWESGLGTGISLQLSARETKTPKPVNLSKDTLIHGASIESKFRDSPLISNNKILSNHRSSLLSGQEDKFNVSLIADGQCRILCWNSVVLESFLMNEKQISKTLSLIIGRDIINKLYAMNEKIISEKGSILDIRLPVLITSLSKHVDTKMLMKSLSPMTQLPDGDCPKPDKNLELSYNFLEQKPNDELISKKFPNSRINDNDLESGYNACDRSQSNNSFKLNQRKLHNKTLETETDSTVHNECRVPLLDFRKMDLKKPNLIK